MDPLLERLELEPLSRRVGHDDLAVDDDPVGQVRLDRLDQLREIPGHRPLVAAADLDLLTVAENDRAEPVPLRLEREVALRDLGDRLCEHRLDRRHHGQTHVPHDIGTQALGDGGEHGWTARRSPTSRRRGRWRSILEERAVRSSELGPAVDHGDAEPAMDHSVVRPTQEHEVRQPGLAAVGPMSNVVSVGPAGWTVTARETTSAVTNRDRSTERSRDDLRLAAELQRLRARIDDHARDRRITREPTS